MKRMLSALCIIMAGCTPRVQNSQSTVFAPVEDEHICCIVFDLSGSFADKMIDGGAAYDFALEVMNRYFIGHIGTRDKIVLAQVSATDKFLLWQGTPLELRQQFPSHRHFADWLRQYADPTGSRVFEGITKAVEYVSSEPAVAAGAKPAMFVLSDLFDTGDDPDSSLSRMTTALGEFDKKGGTIGFYYVGHDLVGDFRSMLQQRGVRNSVVYSEIVAKPEFPEWD